MPSFLQERSENRCASLIEVILVVLALGFIVILLANLPNALGLIQKSRHISLAREIAAKALEQQRTVSYINLVNGTNPISDLRLSLLPQGSGEVNIADCDPLICTNGEPIKQVSAKVSWTAGNKAQQVLLKTFIGEGGLNQ